MFDLDQDDPLKLSNIVGETVVSGWSMKHVILEQKTEQSKIIQSLSFYKIRALIAQVLVVSR